MAVLKSAGRGQVALGGAFGGAADFLQQWFKQRQAEKMQERQNNFVTQREHQGKLESAAEKLEPDVRSGAVSMDEVGGDIIPFLKQRLGSFTGPSQAERMAKITPNVKPDTTDSQIDSMLVNGHANAPMQFDGSGPMLPPQELALKDARDQAKSAQAAGDAREVAQTGAKSGAMEGGKLEAVHAHADETAQDAANLIETTAQPKANAAGLEAGAKFDAEHTPGRVAANAKGAGMVTGAQEATKAPYEMAKMREAEKLREAGFNHDEAVRQSGTTTATRTMMEGAQYMIPQIDKVATQAIELDKKKLFGPVASRLRTLAAKAGSIDEFEAAVGKETYDDPAVGEFATSLGLTASGIARTHGGAKGGGSPMMLAYMKGLLSDSGTLNMFLGRLQGARGLMEEYAAGPKAAGPGNPDLYKGIQPDVIGQKPAGAANRFLQRPE